MDRSLRGHALPIKSIRRNMRISGIRSLVEHPYAFMKKMSGFIHTMVTTVCRVRVKIHFTAICYNLMRIGIGQDSVSYGSYGKIGRKIM